ncbi:MAG: sulfite exporter TauE/SafE family protein [Ignavibacteria bacterium]|nr:sulfite exporter TauE/SafE family protein [Ignavibacteria bacterium]
MELIVIGIASFVASVLTLFSGFGLGTILLPVFSIFLPVETAIASTAIVHLLNNIFKLLLFGKYAERNVLFRFAPFAIVAAFVGAGVLLFLSSSSPLYAFQFFNVSANITSVKLVVAVVMLLFVFAEISPSFASKSFEKKYLPLGGILSGFFGGLSGHQGALRSMFLIRCELSKEEFVGTNVVIASLVDVVRLSVYGSGFSFSFFEKEISIFIVAICSAFLGVIIGAKFLKKITMNSIQKMVALCIILLAIALGVGVL